MKSLTAVCQTGASGMPGISPNGRIARHPPHRGDGENAEMKMYLSKLKDLVPFMPKNRKLSKLEIIQHVIDYICDLQTELETHPEMNNFDAAAALTAAANMPDDSEEDEMQHMEDDDEADLAVDADDLLAQRLAAEQQLAKISSPAARLPLSDRQSPNTLLAPGQPQQQQQQQQQQQLQQQQQQQLANSLATQANEAEKDSRQS
ncbi:protein extra-macrochaetae [Drosophila subobscura]|uniref:protein extra-macrochaetae n=1 Tax=Drosophila subobscura TaxID=7241 RepID=UPI00155A80CE|nr:protein extra-macrochaetae [Drosophila subobscura]